MPWIEVSEPYAKPPRVRPMKPGNARSGSLVIDRGWGELVEVDLDQGSELDLASCTDLSITDSVLAGISFPPERDLGIEVLRSLLQSCDLSQVAVRSLRSTRVEGCKLIGTDLSGASIADVVFDRCTLRYTNLRMAKLSRVEFLDCVLDDVDAYELEAEDVDFPATKLVGVNVDRLKANRVDFRAASEISLTAVGRLSGCLFAEEQLPALAYTLALSAGLDIERHPD